MPGINAVTGLLWTDAEEAQGLQLRQDVEDRLLTARGSRLGRPSYGSTVVGQYPAIAEVDRPIREALAGHRDIESIRIAEDAGTLRVTVNGRVEVVLNV